MSSVVPQAALIAPSHLPLPAQIAFALRDSPGGPGGPLEVTLAPEELGKVRMTFVPTEQGLTLLMVAERPETLELLRRNIADLARELEGLGLPNLAFSFAQDDGDRGRSSDEHAPPAPAFEGVLVPAEPVAARPRILHMADQGLNLRI